MKKSLPTDKQNMDSLSKKGKPDDSLYCVKFNLQAN